MGNRQDGKGKRMEWKTGTGQRATVARANVRASEIERSVVGNKNLDSYVNFAEI